MLVRGSARPSMDPVVSAGATWVIGKVFIQHFASGGTLLDFNPPDYREFIKAQKEKHGVKGAVLREDTPRLLHVDGIDVEAPLEQNLIYMRNQDVPGVIGRVGTVLGKHGINIANFALGRRSGEPPHGTAREAIAVVHVDGAVPEAVVSELRGIPAVQQAKAIHLD